MSNFLLDKCPKFGTTKTYLKDDKGKVTTYQLDQEANNVIVFSVFAPNVAVDQITLTPQDLKALYLLTHVQDCKK